MSGMIIATNAAALNIHRNMKTIGSRLSKATERVSGGNRINSAADDAAGLAISEKMKAQIRGLQQAEKNVEDGINLVKTMDGGMDGIQNMMIRQRELILQGMNDTNTADDRAKIQAEIDQMTAEINAVSNRVEYNKIPLLNVPDSGQWVASPDGSYTIPGYWPSPITLYSNFYMSKSKLSDPTLQSTIKNLTLNASSMQEYHYSDGTGVVQTVSFNIEKYIIDYDVANGEDFKNFVSTDLFADPSNIDPNDVQYFVDRIADALQKGLQAATGDNTIIVEGAYDASDEKIKFGMTSPSGSAIDCWTCTSIPNQNGLGHAIIHNAFSQQSGAGEVVIQPPYVPEQVVNVPGGTNQWVSFGNFLYIQCGANSGQGIFVDRYDCRPESLGIKDLVVDPFEKAKKSLLHLDDAFGKVNEYRSKAGAQQNRLEHTSNFLAVAYNNLEDANSRIADADMAKEMMSVAKENVLQQASVAMLAQANQSPQSVLELLK